jgi:hypothetical protein
MATTTGNDSREFRAKQHPELAPQQLILAANGNHSRPARRQKWRRAAPGAHSGPSRCGPPELRTLLGAAAVCAPREQPTSTRPTNYRLLSILLCPVESVWPRPGGPTACSWLALEGCGPAGARLCAAPGLFIVWQRSGAVVPMRGAARATATREARRLAKGGGRLRAINSPGLLCKYTDTHEWHLMQRSGRPASLAAASRECLVSCIENHQVALVGAEIAKQQGRANRFV